MATIDSVDILKTDKPTYDYFYHLNKLYLLIDMNNDCFRGQDFSYMTVAVTSYEETDTGELDWTKPIHAWVKDFQRYQIVEQFQDDGFPPYNIWTKLTNNWYSVSLTFSFEYNSSEGTIPFESKRATFTFDNRLTTLTGQYYSSFFTGHLRDHLRKNKSFSIWFGITPPEKKINDLIADKKGTRFMQISWIDDNDPDNFQALITEKYFLQFIISLLKNKEVPLIFKEYFNGVAPNPDDAKFTFKLKINNEIYDIYFRGYLQYMIDKGDLNGG
jgi:hypothetical protein